MAAIGESRRSIRIDRCRIDAIEKLLNADGIMTFEQLSQASYDRLKNILNNAGERFRIHDPATWPQQAELAHRGDKVALQKLQDELKGGRAV